MSVNKESRPNFNELSPKAVCSLLSHLALVEDPRGRQGSLHIFTDILAIIVLGTLCGCDDAEKLDEWAEKEESWLSTFLQLPHGTPSQDAFLWALAAMEPSGRIIIRNPI